MRKLIRVLLITVVTIGCIILGISTRSKNGILVTQIETNSEETLSYMIKTKNNNIIMIDGGNKEDAQHLEEVLLENGGVVDRWFITLAHEQNFGAFKEIVQNGNVEIRNIYVSLNSNEWYEKNDPENFVAISEFSDFLFNDELREKVIDVPDKYEILIDDLFISILNIKNEKFDGIYAGYNQSMVIKVDNTYKSIIFMGNIANDAAKYFKDHNLDQIDCDAVQISNNNVQKVNDEIYKMMTPQYLFISTSENTRNSANIYVQRLKELLKSKEIFVSGAGDHTIKIW